jgi:hypothetical protein
MVLMGAPSWISIMAMTTALVIHTHTTGIGTKNLLDNLEGL